MALGQEPFYFRVEDSQTGSVALFGVAAKQLHTDADSQQRLFQVHNHLVETVCLQVRHRTTGFALTRKHHTVCTHQFVCHIRHHGFYTQPTKGIHH